jgi:predicted permease
VASFADLMFVLRRLRHSGSFLWVTVATLVVSLGISTAMFTVVNSFLLSSLPYGEADRLVMIWQSHTAASAKETDDQIPLSPGAFTDLREEGLGFEQIAAFFTEAVNVAGVDGVERVDALFVTEDFFPLLGRAAAIGRSLEPEDGRESAPAVVAISHSYWQSHFGGDPAVLGRTLEFGGKVREVVGVMPADFRFSESLVATDPRLSKPVEIWIPFGLGNGAYERGFHFLDTVGRLRPGVAREAAQKELEQYVRLAAEQYPDTDARYEMRVVLLSDQIFGHLRPVLLTLWAATSLVLLIACANLATLLMARTQRGHRDIVVRLALGASRLRIVGESLAESVGLSLVGGLLSLGAAFMATRLLVALNPVNVFQSYPPRIDLRVILFTIGISLVAGLLFGGLPAVRASRIDTAAGMSEGSGRLTSRSRLAFSILVVSQIALATVLLIGMGLSVRSFRGLLQANLGVNLDRVLTMDLFLPRFRYAETSLKVDFFRQLLEKTKALPGVESVGMNYALPFSGADPSNRFAIKGWPSEEGDDLSANLGLVNPDYFETLEIPILSGRSFLLSDTADAPAVAIIDERMVDLYFDNVDPLGQRISIAGDEELTIIGIVGAVKQDAFEAIARPYVYLPYQQRCYLFTSLAIKTSLRNPLSLAPAVRAVVGELDPKLPISNISTLEAAYRDAISPQRFSLLLICLFAVVSLFLTQIGTYGVMAFLSRQRKQEAGIRMALGASPTQIFWLVFKHGLALSLVGTTIGLAMALAGGKILANLVFGIETRDGLVFSIVVAMTLLAAFVAYYLPARSLSRVDPGSSLRSS